MVCGCVSDTLYKHCIFLYNIYQRTYGIVVNSAESLAHTVMLSFIFVSAGNVEGPEAGSDRNSKCVHITFDLFEQ